MATTRYHILPSLGKARETARNSEPTATESDRRFRHPIYAGLLMNLWRDTGRTPYRDAAWTTIASPADARREIDAQAKPGTFLQTEDLDRRPWQWMQRAMWCNRPEYIGIAVDALLRGHEVLFDRSLNLWAHFGVRGQRIGLPWGRGQGWALYGLVGALELLPRDHGAFETMRQWIDDTAEGLRRTQDPATGLWRNILTEPATRLEVSGTAKIVKHLSRAWRLNLCRAPFVPDMLKRAWLGLKAHTFEHRTCSRCYGTGPGVDVPFYQSLGAAGSYHSALQAASNTSAPSAQ